MSDLKKQIAALERDAAALAGGFSEVFRESEPPPAPQADPRALVPLERRLFGAPIPAVPRASGRVKRGGYWTFDRDFYLPKQLRGTPPTYHHPEGTDLDFWFYEEGGKPYGIAFRGKGQRPLWHHWFRGDIDRQRKTDKTITNRKGSIAYKTDRAAARKAFKHSLKVGDILDSSWGYDQTNIDFYEVIDVLDGMVVVRKIAQRVVSTHEGGSEHVVPVPGKFVGPPLRKRVREGNSITVDDHYASPWDGSSRYQTSLGWGH